MKRKREPVIVDNKYGRLVVLELIPSITGKGVKRVMARCRCDCGNEKVIRTDALGRSTHSCGCLDKEIKSKRFSERNKETGKFDCFTSKHPDTYVTWSTMKARCYFPSQKTYEKYGAKGVVVCQWLKASPWNLLELIGERPEKTSTIDRYPIHDGNYTCGQCDECKEKGWQLNVRWATRKQQAENRGDFNVHLTAFGKTMLLSQWQETSGISAKLITSRIRRDGWAVEMALGTPDGKGHCYKP